MPPSPGTYLRQRREAAGRTIADVALLTPTDPNVPAHQREEWLALIEADTIPMAFSTILAMRRAFAFDLNVLERLDRIHHGEALPAPRLCRLCACSWEDACQHDGSCCWWVEDDLCSRCAERAAGELLLTDIAPADGAGIAGAAS